MTGWEYCRYTSLTTLHIQLVYTAESAAAYYVVAYWKGFANNGMSDQERLELDPSSKEWQLRVNGSKTHVIGLLLYATLLWLLKGCWVVYYLRLTYGELSHVNPWNTPADRYSDGLPSQRFLTKWAIFLMPLTFVSCLLVAFLKCIPFDHQWQIHPSPGSKCRQTFTLQIKSMTHILQTIACRQYHMFRPFS